MSDKGQWDDEQDEKPMIPVAVAAAAAKAKWDGEDEDDDVKDSWEDFDDDAPTEDTKESEVKGEEVPSGTVKKKMTLKEKIAEKEEQTRKEKEDKKRLQDSEDQAKQTPQQMLEERERHRRLQEEYELELVKKEFGGAKDGDKCGLESMCPTNREEFEAFKKGLIATISKHEKSSFYIQFVDELFRELCLNMESDDVKKLGNTLTVLANEKNKAAKAQQLKAKKKPKGKATLVVGRANDYADYGEYDGGGGNDYDDFM